MNICYESQNDSIKNYRSYTGINFSTKETHTYLQGKVKDKLLDREELNIQRQDLENLKILIEESGFTASECLLIDIQALYSEELNVNIFRIGEAYAEVILEEYFFCRFYWNELRDTRNPKGNKPGADLVGFIKIEGEILFLFGEVKTSSENRHPPQVMRDINGIEKQLKNLYNDIGKRRILISYLSNKARLFPDEHPFKKAFMSGRLNYYSGQGRYQLIGVLVRDTEPDEEDLKNTYNKLDEKIQNNIGIKLVALYVPIKKDTWLKIINKTDGNDK